MVDWRAILLLAASVTPLSADLKLAETITVQGTSSDQVSYYRGKKQRMDSPQRGCSIIRNDRSTLFLDLSRKQFAEGASPGLFATLAAWIARPPRERDSGKTVDVYYQQTDTGEQAQRLGYTARHLVLRERRIAQSGACETSQETIRDGWYVSRDQIKVRLPRYAAYLSAGGFKCVDHIVEHGSAADALVPLLETTTRTFLSGPSTPPGFSMRNEITALSTTPLDESVFEVPADFKKVDEIPRYVHPLSWTARMEFEWRQLVRAAESWTD